ncbi:MAG: IS110 family transposase [Actinobacteria bacterium]|nr:IS110 family transposase [Actinomycetota bacterium]
MNQKVYVGIDLAKDSSRVAVVDKDGSKLTSPFSIKNTRDGMEKLLSKLNSYRNDEILCGMEASSLSLSVRGYFNHQKPSKTP